MTILVFPCTEEQWEFRTKVCLLSKSPKHSSLYQPNHLLLNFSKKNTSNEALCPINGIQNPDKVCRRLLTPPSILLPETAPPNDPILIPRNISIEKKENLRKEKYIAWEGKFSSMIETMDSSASLSAIVTGPTEAIHQTTYLQLASTITHNQDAEHSFAKRHLWQRRRVLILNRIIFLQKNIILRRI